MVLLENYVKRLITIDYPQYRMRLFFADVLILIDHITGKILFWRIISIDESCLKYYFWNIISDDENKKSSILKWEVLIFKEHPRLFFFMTTKHELVVTSRDLLEAITTCTLKDHWSQAPSLPGIHLVITRWLFGNIIPVLHNFGIHYCQWNKRDKPFLYHEYVWEHRL